MKSTDLTKNGVTSDTRINIESAPGDPSKQASDSDNDAVLMNMASGPKSRGSRADALIEMAGMDNYRLTNEPGRKMKMKG